MDHKTLKTDLTYCLKKFQKEGKILSAFDGNLEINDENQFVLSGNEYEPLEALVLVKGYVPTTELISLKGGYSLSLLDLLVKETGIAKSDWYAFLDGFDHVAFTGKNEFYSVGAYLREKFQPYNARTESLKPQYYTILSLKEQGRTPVKKFVIHSVKKNTSIVQAECYILSPTDYTGSSSLREGEYAARVAAPEILFEKKFDGTIGPAIFFSHFLFDTEEDARAQAEKEIRQGFETAIRKHKIVSYTEEEVQTKLAEIKTVML